MKISETFHSIQGEGHLTGKPMFFIRAQGCSVKCPIREVCDQPESLVFRGGTEYAPATLAEMALAAVGPRGWVSITGGEPLDQPDFDELVAACRKLGLFINVQTSGLRRVNAPWDWCTVSPKAPVDELAILFAQELKVVYTGQSLDQLRAYYERFSAWNYYLQPCADASGTNTEETIEKVFELNRLGMQWEFSAQWHKYLGVR
jgi:organic radical activating enzyme